MSRDYAKTNTRRKASHSNSPSGWVWLTTGLLVGLFCAGLIYLKNYNDKQTAPAPTAAAPKVKPIQPASAVEAPKRETPRFDFYTILPKMQVSVGDTDTAIPATQTLDQKIEAPSTDIKKGEDKYFLQVAAFPNYADADRLKAQLILLGFNVEVIPVKSGTNRWNRVQVGPFNSLAQTEKEQRRLLEAKHKSLVRKLGTA